GSDTLPNYQPQVLVNSATTDYYFRRQVTSGACKQYSDSVVITVLSPIMSNDLTGPSEICQGSIPGPIQGLGVVTGGLSDNYIYSWQESSVKGTWNLIPGANNASYSPGTIADTTWYRRIVTSGPYNCCRDTSRFLSINLIHPPVNNDTSFDDN